MKKYKKELFFVVFALWFWGACGPDSECTLPTSECVTDFEIIKVEDSFVENGGVNGVSCLEDPCQLNVIGSSKGLQQSFYLHVYVRGFGSGNWFRSQISSELDVGTGEWARVIQLGWQGDPPQGKVFTIVGIVSAEDLNKDQYQVVGDLDENLPRHLKTPFITISVAN